MGKAILTTVEYFLKDDVFVLRCNDSKVIIPIKRVATVKTDDPRQVQIKFYAEHGTTRTEGKDEEIETIKAIIGDDIPFVAAIKGKNQLLIATGRFMGLISDYLSPKFYKSWAAWYLISKMFQKNPTRVQKWLDANGWLLEMLVERKKSKEYTRCKVIEEMVKSKIWNHEVALSALRKRFSRVYEGHN